MRSDDCTERREHRTESSRAAHPEPAFLTCSRFELFEPLFDVAHATVQRVVFVVDGSIFFLEYAHRLYRERFEPADGHRAKSIAFHRHPFGEYLLHLLGDHASLSTLEISVFLGFFPLEGDS